MMRPDFERALRMLQGCYGKTLTASEFDAYWTVLGHLDIDDFDTACRAAMTADKPYMPKPGQLLALSGGQSRSGRTMAQVAAGASPADRDRPRRIGRSSVEGYSPSSRSYHRMIMRHMSAGDFDAANEARRSALDEMPRDLAAARDLEG